MTILLMAIRTWESICMDVLKELACINGKMVILIKDCLKTDRRQVKVFGKNITTKKVTNTSENIKMI